MRKFHKEKQSEASGKRKGKNLPQGSGSMVTQGLPMFRMFSSSNPGQIEFPFRAHAEDTQSDSARDGRQLVGLNKALVAELSANYCPSLPGSVLMIVEPVPPLITRFPVPQDSMRHVHFCMYIVNKQCLRCGVEAEDLLGMLCAALSPFRTRLILGASDHDGEQVLNTYDTKCPEWSKPLFFSLYYFFRPATSNWLYSTLYHLLKSMRKQHLIYAKSYFLFWNIM